MTIYLGAHTDDIELGCGGSIVKDSYGFTFTCTSAFRHLLPEMLNSFKVLGINHDTKIRQDFQHRNIDRQMLLDELIKIRDKYNPTTVFTHSSFDTHQDHQVIHNETLRAFKHCNIIGYQLPWNDLKGSKYTYYKGIDLKKKQEALKCYKSQRNRTYFNGKYQASLAMVAGQECGKKFAEKFEVIRWID